MQGFYFHGYKVWGLGADISFSCFYFVFSSNRVFHHPLLFSQNIYHKQVINLAASWREAVYQKVSWSASISLLYTPISYPTLIKRNMRTIWMRINAGALSQYAYEECVNLKWWLVSPSTPSLSSYIYNPKSSCSHTQSAEVTTTHLNSIFQSPFAPLGGFANIKEAFILCQPALFATTYTVLANQISLFHICFLHSRISRSTSD
jgi:hypothetical protein